GLTRREVLRVGGLGLGGLTLSSLLQAQAGAAPGSRSFGRARSCILLYMVGGPPQHETWDPKPEASAEIRGAYQAIPSSLDGLQVGELMPRLAKQAHRCAVIRSAATDINAHTGSGYFMLTGHPHRTPSGESIPPDSADWPTLGAVMKRVLPSGRDLPSVVWLPEPVKNNPGIYVAGQNAGFMAPEHEPFLLECDPNTPGFQVPGLTPLPGLGAGRMDRRRSLLAQVNGELDRALRDSFVREDLISDQAFDLLTSGRTRRAFDLGQETPQTRDRYGRHKFGQSCLLARRLVEAGTRLVTVAWPREPNDFGIGNPVWDTHGDNAGRLKNALMPPMDEGVSALLEDLATRGLLDETLVVWMGEFGRSPKHNGIGGRDHWGHVFSMMMAGGGIRPGIVHGESDKLGAYPQTDRVGPEAIHATIYHCLGVSPNVEITDRLDRPLRACDGEPLAPILL
ncbi:MAG: hypothetical protein K0Q72_642, partial [Armatimonadetes bacterium]|nr:hypothetical protein [Armatimonadota bacterium]